MVSAPPASAHETDEAHDGDLSLEQIGEAMQSVLDRVWAPRSRYADGPRVREAFRPVVAEARRATVQVRSRGKRIALGGVVGPDGWVLTKASLVHGRLTCRLCDGRELPARLVGVDRENDLAMLKVDATDLPALDLESTGPPNGEAVALRPAGEPLESPGSDLPAPQGLRDGDWVATVGLGNDPQAVGVVSVGVREIPKRRGLLGVMMDLRFKGRGARVDAVGEQTGAAEAGVLAGDVVTAVDGSPITSAEELREAIGDDRNPGDEVELRVLRGEESLTLRAVLSSVAPNPAERRAHYQNNLGGRLSERRFGFKRAIQHDTVLSPQDCGGPLVDLDGRVVGFNIARAGRTESYALPVDLVRERLYDLMSGRLSPQDSGDEGS